MTNIEQIDSKIPYILHGH